MRLAAMLMHEGRTLYDPKRPTWPSLSPRMAVRYEAVMLTLDATARAEAAQLIKQQAATGLEHCWAIDASGTVFTLTGTANSVVASPALMTLYQTPGAGVRYHHSHPDERALSPSDLELIGKPGVNEIWAHTPDGGAIGAAVMAGVPKARYQHQLQLICGFLGADIYRANFPPGLSDQDYERIRDITLVEALHAKGWIDACIQASLTAYGQIYAVYADYRRLRRFFEANLPPP